MMPRDPQSERLYQESMDNLRILAQQDLADWWADTEGLDDPMRADAMEEAFGYVQRTYGEQAAYSAADYLFMQRSLDESLAGLEYPKVADPASHAQAQGSYRWATGMWRTYQDEASLAVAKKRLSGILNRLVAQPANETVVQATLSAGTGFARVPEPGGCDFCLMLASRGAAYSRETVLGASRFHDNCRCLGIEVKSDEDLPRINRELMDLWEATGDASSFGTAIRDRREAVQNLERWRNEAQRLDPKIKSEHITDYKTKKRSIRGGHTRGKLDEIAAKVRSGEAKLTADAGKTFFPEWPGGDEALIEWLESPEAVAAVVADPDRVETVGRYGMFAAKRVSSPAGGEIELAVQIGKARENEDGYESQITSVFGVKGDGIIALNKDGSIEERGWD